MGKSKEQKAEEFVKRQIEVTQNAIERCKKKENHTEEELQNLHKKLKQWNDLLEIVARGD